MFRYLFTPKSYLRGLIFLIILGLVFIPFGFPSFGQRVFAATLFVEISADPSSGPAPLNDVDLTAIVYGTATGDITYKFDCENDGSWEKTITTASPSFTAVDLCDYPNPGTFSARVRVERGNLTFEGTTAIFVLSGPTLSVNLSANPSSGTSPLLDVDLTATVSGTASGDITYKFDCTSDGSWEKIITTSSTSYTAVDLCDYPSAGNYTATVKVERGGLSFQGTTAILVKEVKTLFVELTADPSLGYAPLNDVDLIATVSGTASGDITYKFDCTNNGTWEKIITTGSNPYTALDLCDYPSVGNYTAKVMVEREGLTAQDTTEISVQEIPTLRVSVSASPSSGHAPLEDVDITVNVSGTASGDITYKFDCTSDGSWEKIITASSTSYTANDLCDYHSPGLYSIKVSVERGGLLIEGNTNVVVGEIATLAVDFSADPSSGEAPLLDVDLIAYVSGTASGDITYKFDCRDDGNWEKIEVTSSTSYIAYDLCGYSSAGVYRAKVRVERGGNRVEGTANILVSP